MRFLVLLLCLFATAAGAAAPQPPTIIGRSWLIGDLSSGQILASHKADERIEPASLTKLMTAYVVFGALRDKKISLAQQVPVSVRAWRAPGSRCSRATMPASRWPRRWRGPRKSSRRS
jgi:D-alanyl-D-alanine carboxypeptidase (penicillin-binding protein 5/6)